jgi:signal transduction histidine kinase
MDTYFAPAGRAAAKDLAAEIEIVSNNPIVSGLLHSISGLLAVLDEHRQIVALNVSFLELLGIDDQTKALGLRPGEVLQCIHAQDEPDGCGTTRFCSTCGAAISIVVSLGEDRPVERMCALSARRGDREVDIALLVRSHPIKISDKRYLLLFLQDISIQQQRAALERVFFHDVNNMLSMLTGASELLVKETPSDLARTLRDASVRLQKEVAIQRCLSQNVTCDYQPMRQNTTTGQILKDITSFFNRHPVAYKKNITIQENFPDIMICTDVSLLSRILCNMIINALEATEDQGVVKIWLEHNHDLLTFCVWNYQEIPQEIAGRIFQRNFSTKEQAGRGIGTFSMKLFGEKILGGRVSFTTSKKEGTIFRFDCPI